ncbi:histidine kinase [Fulvivirga ulvae]|uniref:ATP-binding protein n=1 Tax=Fulvivirga ulvae TaxID=2904245 RepID=UPI001F440521|nr:ATP-binding protein [Fulvivirga ulvae]UII34439.1 histidine kinase [Fulvivirga ulvae]
MMVKQNKFDKLGWFYLIALSCIALSIVVSQFFIQNYIDKQQDDSRIVNVAGRQRMLSQRISKIVLQVKNQHDPTLVKTYLKDLEVALNLWVDSHLGLLSGNSELGLTGDNSEKVIGMFRDIEPHYAAIVGSTREIINAIKKRDSVPDDILEPHIRNILLHEGPFLEGMDKIVFQYDSEAQAKVTRLSKVEILLLIVSLTIILVELIFIFRPIARNVRQTVAELVISEEKSIKMASEMSRVYEELVKSYQELEAVNLKPEVPALYATMDKHGEFIFFSPAFKRLLEYEVAPDEIRSLLLSNDYNRTFITGLLNIVNEGQTWSGEIKLMNGGGDFCWLELYIIPVQYQNNIEHKLIARDITEIKEARVRSWEINREKIEARVREQQYRSVLILEGQEEERQRLGREIHDGIGQMLTALKLSLESITPSSSRHTKKRLEDTRDLMKSILKEVRRISFNLTPSSLSDFGIVPAVKKFCQEVDRLSAPDVIFENKTSFVNRLDQHIENNLYRIIQEGVNNAIKYASAKTIRVTFEHDTKVLKIVIEDNGKGFDYEKLINSGHFKNSGHGIFNMKERTAFINGNFELFSRHAKGTRIVIKLPLD